MYVLRSKNFRSLRFDVEIVNARRNNRKGTLPLVELTRLLGNLTVGASQVGRKVLMLDEINNFG